MPDEAILEIKQVNGLSLSADKAWQGDSNVYLEMYRALVTSGMLADISGNALKVLVAMGLRARVLGGDAEGESLFRHLVSLKLVSEADRGKLFCYATQEDLLVDCGLGSRNTLAQAIRCLTDHQLIEKRSRHRQRRRDASSYVANVYLIRPASSIRKFNTGYTPSRAQKEVSAPDAPVRGRQQSHLGDQKVISQPQLGDQFLITQPHAGDQNLITQPGGRSKTVHNKKEEDEEGEEEKISSILARFATRQGDPAGSGGPQERRKVQGLLDEGYSAEQIATAIDQAFDARPANARPVRGFGFIVSYVHRRLLPDPRVRGEATTGTPTEMLTGEIPRTLRVRPTGAPTGVSTESETCSMPTGVSHLPAPDGPSDDPFSRIQVLLQAASTQGIEGVADIRYDLPGTRLGIRDLLEREAPRTGSPPSPDEVYDAVLAAVVRNVPPERLVAYAGAVLENARAEAQERERLCQVIAETVHTGQGNGELRAEVLEPSVTAAQGAEHPPPDSRALALWQSALGELEMQMTRATFNTWLRPARLLAWEPVHGDGSGNGSTRVILGVPNEYVRDWLENRLLTPIRRTLCGVAGQPVEIDFQVEGVPEQMQ